MHRRAFRLGAFARNRAKSKGNGPETFRANADDAGLTSEGSAENSRRRFRHYGDLITQQFPVYVEEISLSAPEIELEQYISYISVGESFDIEGNVVSATSSDGEDLKAQLNIDTNLDTSTPGMYEIHYRVTDGAGKLGHKIAIVVVE